MLLLLVRLSLWPSRALRGNVLLLEYSELWVFVVRAYLVEELRLLAKQLKQIFGEGFQLRVALVDVHEEGHE